MSDGLFLVYFLCFLLQGMSEKKNLPNKLKGVYVYLIYRGYQLYCIVTCFLGLKDLQNQNRCLLLIFVALRHLGKTGCSLMILFFMITHPLPPLIFGKLSRMSCLHIVLSPLLMSVMAPLSLLLMSVMAPLLLSGMIGFLLPFFILPCSPTLLGLMYGCSRFFRTGLICAYALD